MQSKIKYVLGNWKMHGTHDTLHALLEPLKTMQLPPHVHAAVFPPFTYLEKVGWLLRHAQLTFGAQNVSAFEKGAYTGEISAAMLKDVGCHYVLIGHSERRRLFKEDNAMIAEKCLRAAEAGLQPILCVGETAEDYRRKQTQQIVFAQLASVLNLSAMAAHLSMLIIAYEPVWAIGTGLTATPTQAQAVHAFLRETLTEHREDLASVPLVYGGSVNGKTAKALFSMPDIDGVLVGGASLDAEEFRTICHLAE